MTISDLLSLLRRFPHNAEFIGPVVLPEIRVLHKNDDDDIGTYSGFNYDDPNSELYWLPANYNE